MEVYKHRVIIKKGNTQAKDEKDRDVLYYIAKDTIKIVGAEHNNDTYYPTDTIHSEHINRYEDGSFSIDREIYPSR